MLYILPYIIIALEPNVPCTIQRFKTHSEHLGQAVEPKHGHRLTLMINMPTTLYRYKENDISIRCVSGSVRAV